MKKHCLGILALTMVLMLACLVLPSCGPKPPAQTETPAVSGPEGSTTTPAAGKQLRVGVTLMNRQHDFYKDLELGLQEEADKEGMTLIVRDANMNLANQVSQIEDFIVQKVDAIIVCPVDSKGIVTAV